MRNDIHSDIVDSESYSYSDDNNYNTSGSSDPHYFLYESYASYLHRILASSPASSTMYKIDYNVLSVAAMTLALIMMVEYFRHRLDHWAYQAATTETPQQPKQPLFRAVLEGVYAERRYSFIVLCH